MFGVTRGTRGSKSCYTVLDFTKNNGYTVRGSPRDPHVPVWSVGVPLLCMPYMQRWVVGGARGHSICGGRYFTTGPALTVVVSSVKSGLRHHEELFPIGR